MDVPKILAAPRPGPIVRGAEDAMEPFVERRKQVCRIIGVERRGAPVPTLEGRPLPDPTVLLDETFPQRDPDRAEARRRPVG